MRLDLRLPAEREAVAAARRCVGSLERVIDPRLLEDAKLVVSELVTNSIRHAHLEPSDEVEVTVEADNEHVRLLVRDSGRGFEPPTERSDDIGGWGLYLVDRVSGRWGVEQRGGTCVWVELARSDAGSSNAETRLA